MLSENVKKARRNKGLTQKELSEKIGVKPGTLAGYETGNSEHILAPLSGAFF